MGLQDNMEKNIIHAGANSGSSIWNTNSEKLWIKKIECPSVLRRTLRSETTFRN